MHSPFTKTVLISACALLILATGCKKADEKVATKTDTQNSLSWIELSYGGIRSDLVVLADSRGTVLEYTAGNQHWTQDETHFWTRTTAKEGDGKPTHWRGAVDIDEHHDVRLVSYDSDSETLYKTDGSVVVFAGNQCFITYPNSDTREITLTADNKTAIDRWTETRHGQAFVWRHSANNTFREFNFGDNDDGTATGQFYYVDTVSIDHDGTIWMTFRGVHIQKILTSGTKVVIYPQMHN